MSQRAMFLLGMAIGAWLNIWPAAFWPWGGFCFAYLLLAIAFGVLVTERA